ncbi:MAG: cell wall hydrolase, partial [Microcystis sp.]
GKIGVGYTVINRVSIAQARGDYWWGNTIREVCLKPYQYSCWNANDPSRAVIIAVRPGNRIFDRCLVIARQVIDRAIANPVRRSTHYYATYIAAPDWTRGKNPYVQLGVHKFYENIR